MRLIVASATLDAEKFVEFFNLSSSESSTSVALSVEGKLFPLEILHVQNPVPNYINATCETVIKIHEQQPQGDILCFMTGQDDIMEVYIFSKIILSQEKPPQIIQHGK